MAAIYNTTDGPLAVDPAGRVVGAYQGRDDVDVTVEPLASHIAAGRVLVTKPDPEPILAAVEEPSDEDQPVDQPAARSKRTATRKD